MVKLTMEEAAEVVRRTFHNNKLESETYDALPETTKLQAMVGAIGIVEALQQMGFRVSRPLEVVK